MLVKKLLFVLLSSFLSISFVAAGWGGGWTDCCRARLAHGKRNCYKIVESECKYEYRNGGCRYTPNGSTLPQCDRRRLEIADPFVLGDSQTVHLHQLQQGASSLDAYGVQCGHVDYDVNLLVENQHVHIHFAPSPLFATADPACEKEIVAHAGKFERGKKMTVIEEVNKEEEEEDIESASTATISHVGFHVITEPFTKVLDVLHELDALVAKEDYSFVGYNCGEVAVEAARLFDVDIFDEKLGPALLSYVATNLVPNEPGKNWQETPQGQEVLDYVAKLDGDGGDEQVVDDVTLVRKFLLHYLNKAD